MGTSRRAPPWCPIVSARLVEGGMGTSRGLASSEVARGGTASRADLGLDLGGEDAEEAEEAAWPGRANEEDDRLEGRTSNRSCTHHTTP